MDNDLISRSALILEFCDRPDYSASMFKKIRRRINAAPAVDAVEVVRCKDCIHYEKFPDYANECWNSAGMLDVYDDGFCSCGERRTE